MELKLWEDKHKFETINPKCDTHKTQNKKKTLCLVCYTCML
jgi:hypothetical protein